jgi:uncharacterized membrane protein YgdD (TMEM256/DUF423 family)
MMQLSQSLALRLSAVTGAFAVGLGAFGAHALKPMLLARGFEDTWKTAVLYHLAHAVVLLVLALAEDWRPRAWLSFACGLLLFSGSLYLLCLTNLRWLGAITPLGGVALILGWVLLMFKRSN